MRPTSKIAILGTGHVGSHVALECALSGLARDIVLLDIDRKKARGHAIDIMDAIAYSSRNVNVYEGWYEDVADADVAVMCACAVGYESSDRLKELQPTLRVADEVANGLIACGFAGMLVSISNPCDIIAQYLQKRTGLTVIGTGTALDSGRFRIRLAQALCVDVTSVQGYCLGEHGDSQVPAISTVTVGGIPLSQLKDAYPHVDFAAIRQATVRAGWDIVTGKGCTEFGIACAAARLIRAILRDEQTVMPCSILLDGQYGGKGIYASIPCAISRQGAHPLPEMDLTSEERAALAHSFETLKRHLPEGT